MVFLSKGNSAILTFTYDGTPLELVTQFIYLGITLTRDGSIHTAAEKMADNFRSTTAGGDQHLVLDRHAQFLG